jgi:hypothetical protein
MSRKYKAVLFSLDGDWVTDHRRGTIEAVEGALADQGSRWYFYPFHAVIIDHGQLTTKRQRLVSVAEPFEDFKGKSISTFKGFLGTCSDEFFQAVLS